LYGRHLVTFATTGSFDPRFSGFDSYGAFDRNNNRVSTQGTTDLVLDASSVLIDPDAQQPRTDSAAFSAFAAYNLTPIDIVTRIVGKEPSYDAIIIDALGGDDSITVGSTTQKTVWVDAGDGNDTVKIAPAIAYLPDATDPPTFTTVKGVPVRGNNDQAT